MRTRLRVLVVDDSRLMRKLIANLLTSDPGIEVVGTAGDSVEAIKLASELRPDVITLDIEMSGMSGLEVLGYVMSEMPTPVIVVSGPRAPEVAIQSLELGAVDFILKPSGTISVDLYKIQEDLLAKVKMAPLARLSQIPAPWSTKPPAAVKMTRPALASRSIVGIAASTGGPQALEHFLPQLSADLPAALIIVQHMPPGFTRSLAQRMNRYCAITVKEATHRERVEVGRAYIAPGDHHLTVRSTPDSPGDGFIYLDQSPPIGGLRPSANMMLRSIAEVYGSRAVGVVLTGMGSDGREGLKLIKERGGFTIAQDQATSVIFGMPQAAIESGCVNKVVPLDGIAGEIVAQLQAQQNRR
jgi:two-component system chemotaxis response regulator CheB